MLTYHICRRDYLWSGWPLRNIHVLNNKGSFTLYLGFFFSLSLPRRLPDLTVYMKNGGCLIRSRNCLPFSGTWIQPRILAGVCVAHLFSFLLCVFVLFVFVLCLVYPVLPVSLIVHSWLLFLFSLTFIWVLQLTDYFGLWNFFSQQHFCTFNWIIFCKRIPATLILLVHVVTSEFEGQNKIRNKRKKEPPLDLDSRNLTKNISKISFG